MGGRRFGIVYTGKGALTWLPDLTRWADVCRRVVAPGGVLYLSEFHPAGNVFDWGDDLSLTYSYFTDEPTVNETRGTCADLDAQTHEKRGVEWHHQLGEIVTAIAAAGFRIDFLSEYPFMLYPR